MKKVMFICSVGGHLTQILELKKIFENYEYTLVTEKTSITKNLQEKYNIEYLAYGSRFYFFKYLFVFTYNFFKSIKYFFKYNPEVIVTTGSHTAVPMCYLGWIFRRKVIFIESYAKSSSGSLSGKLVYPVATKFIVQWESMLDIYPKAEYW